MATPKRKPRRKPASTEEGREHQLVSLAIDLAEKQIIDGSASSQVITHFLKLGSSRERLEQKRLGQETEMLATKAELMESGKRQEGLYAEALEAMRAYAGQEVERAEQDEYYED